MLLASVKEMREALGFDDMTDINSAITEGLNSVEAQIASLLSTSFARQTVVDRFFVYGPGFVQGAHVQTEFRLSRGFLTDAPIVATRSTSPNLFEPGGSNDLSTALFVNAEKGVVKDYSTRYAGEFVEITYTAGFELEMSAGADPQPTGSYVLAQVPSWLQEAAKVKTLMAIATHPSVSNAAIDLDAKSLGAQYAAIINPKLRYAPSALIPL